MVISCLMGSGIKVIDNLAVDLSKIKWQDSGVPMFNVTVLSERNSKLNKKASPTLHIVELDF